MQLRFLADRQFANRHGTVQGGMLAAILNSATGNAVMAGLPRDRTAVTTRLDTTFVKPAALGPLTANARLVTQDERSAVAEAELLDSSGQIVATPAPSYASASAATGHDEFGQVGAAPGSSPLPSGEVLLQLRSETNQPNFISL